MPTATTSDHSALVATVISITVAIIIFTFGLVCGCLCQKYKQSIFGSCKTQSSTKKRVQQDSRSYDLEMTENVAYGPLAI